MQLNEAITQMAELRKALQNDINTICENTRYSTAGQVHEVAKAIAAANQEAVELRDVFIAGNDTAQRQLSRKLFGIGPAANPSTVIAYRDATDRATQITDPGQLASALTRAIDMGDTSMASAIAARAQTLGANDIVATYATSTGQTDTYNELQAIPTGRNINTATAVVFSVGSLSLPPDVAQEIYPSGMGDTRQLEKLAATPPEAPTKPSSGPTRAYI
ncbi:hypothetical protein BST33_10035 [Mycolicibacter minnesotensis]|uniref:Uncharacterized protein n=1 Tax=Mycolicibacter minnesotensis TaxID=1118379 RepID=A0A7I7R417_9MYCO|nr:hypothetical protein [Mycolicibacter minnesotensis]ORB01098.1 hypothetical protein BST33_10035 [Mycolicibacter minnesotensis]BBY33358.1 hypothetical protein MMIN_14190 [Mycolicibacter minnesotensis]